MTSRTRWLVALTGVLVVGTGGVAIAGQADTEITRFKTQKLGPGSAEYRVKIESDDPNCIEGRTVEIKHKGVVIGTGVTGPNGRATIIGARPPKGDKVIAKVIENEDCEGATKSRKFKP